MIVTILSLLVVVVILFVGLVWALQERIAFQPPQVSSSVTARSAKLVKCLAEDGQVLLAYVVGKPDIAQGLLIWLEDALQPQLEKLTSSHWLVGCPAKNPGQRLVLRSASSALI